MSDCRAAWKIRSSSVARTTLETSGHMAARRMTCQNMGRPWIRARGLPGKRELWYLAGTMARTSDMGHLHERGGPRRHFRKGPSIEAEALVAPARAAM